MNKLILLGSIMNCWLSEELYLKGYRICCVGTNTVNDRRELICYDTFPEHLVKQLEKYLNDNYCGIKNYKVSYAYPDDYAVLLYCDNENDEWEIKEKFNFETGKPKDFYDAWNSGDGSLTKPARK